MILVLVVIALLIIFLWRPREFMTNADVQTKLDFMKSGSQQWEVASKMTPQSTHKKALGQAIRGPEVPEVDTSQPDPSKVPKGNKPSAGAEYPLIYGPDSLKPPGQRDYEPAAEFPAGPEAPEPYLNDFSAILNSK